MFSKDTSMHINEANVSGLCNNLNIMHLNDSTVYAVVCRSVVVLFSVAKDGTTSQRTVGCRDAGSSSSGAIILQAKLVDTSQKLLVIAATNGIHIYDADGSAMLYHHGSQSTKSYGDNNSQGMGYFKGIAAISKNTLCIGNSSGLILVFNIPSLGNGISLTTECEAHICSIWELCGREYGPYENNLISSDEEGELKVWTFSSNKLELKFKVVSATGVSGLKWPVNSIMLWDAGDCFITGTASGLICIYDLRTGRLMVEINAHGRQINALSLASEVGLLASASEDTFCRIWKLEKTGEKTMRVTQIQSEIIADQMLQGVQFLNSQGDRLCLNSFDSHELFFFKKN